MAEPSTRHLRVLLSRADWKQADQDLADHWQKVELHRRSRSRLRSRQFFATWVVSFSEVNTRYGSVELKITLLELQVLSAAAIGTVRSCAVEVAPQATAAGRD